MDLTKQRDGVVKTSIRQVDEENLRITHTVNTKAFDRYDSIVLPRGADVKHFLNNPVVLWSHNHDEATAKIPIARCVDLDIREDEIVVTTEFNKNDALAVKVFNAYKDGFLNTWSIGFIPKKYKRMDVENIEDINKKYNLSVSKEQVEEAYCGAYLVYDWELLEYSAVPVPGNPEALSADGVSGYTRELVSRGLLDSDSAENFSFKSFIEKEEASDEAVVEKEVVEKEVSEEQADARSEDAPVENNEESEEVPVEEVAEQEEPVEEVVEEVAEEAVEEESEVAEEEEAPAEEVSEEAEPEAEVVEEVQVEESDEVIDENLSDSTEDIQEESVPVAEEIEEVVEEQKNQNEKEALEKTVEELNQRNQELSERVAKMEETVKELASINSTLSEIKKSLEVDNIEKVRESVLQKNKGTNPDTFFSNLFRE